MSIANIFIRVFGAIGGALFFAGLMNHYAGLIQPNSDYIYFMASLLTEFDNSPFSSGQSIDAAAQHVEHKRQFGRKYGPAFNNNGASERVYIDGENNIVGDNGHSKHYVQGSNNRVNFDGDAFSNVDENAIIDSGSQNVLIIEEDGAVNFHRLASVSNSPGYTETGYIVMAVDMSDTSLGLSISGLTIYLVAGIALLFLNYSSPYFAKYTILLSSTFIVGFMYFVTKLSVDDISTWTSAKSNEALFIPMSVMFAAFLVACWALWTIPDLAGTDRAMNITAKTLLTTAMLLGCLFFPMGVIGLTQDSNFNVGIGLLGASLALGVVGYVVARVGDIALAGKSISPTAAEHPTVPLGTVMGQVVEYRPSSV